jgi:hypothetical protein
VKIQFSVAKCNSVDNLHTLPNTVALPNIQHTSVHTLIRNSPAFYITNQRCRNCRNCRKTTTTLNSYNLAYQPASLPLNWNTQCPRIYDCPCQDCHHSDTTYNHLPVLQISCLVSKARAGQIGEKQVREIAPQLNPLTYTALT